MKTTLAAFCLVVSAVTVPIAAFAADTDADRSNPTAFVKDSSITTKIKSQLAAQHMTSLGRISVDTDNNGIVYLSGTARTQADIDKAISIAKSTENVKSVKSTITIKADD